MSPPEENQMMPKREEKEEKTQKAKEEKHPSLDHEAQKHHNKNVTVILDLEESTSTTSSSKTSSSSPSNSESSFPFTPPEQKRIIRQIDLRVVLLLGAMYAVSLIDRSQIGLAMISGMGTDLQLTVGARYNIINAVFFGPYVLFQLPSTVLLRKIGPKRFLSGATLAWGLATLACGFVREWRDLVALRVVLGACEAGFYPASIYLLSTWYTRYELQKRFAGLLILGVIPAAFSGILAFGISHLEGRGIAGGGPFWWGRSLKQKNPLDATSSDDDDHLSYGPGLAGWRWIFILYGITTCVIAGVAWFLLVDFPEKIAFGRGTTMTTTGDHVNHDDGDGENEKKSSRWWWRMRKNKKRVAFLTKQEAAWAVHRIEKDRNDVMPGEFHLSSYLSPILSLQVWSFALLYCLSGTIGYGINFALPLILHKGMGLSTPVSQCLVTPPYLAAAGVTWIEAYYADQWRVRSPFILGNCVAVGVGLCLIGFVQNVGVRYFGVFLAAIPSTANGPCILTWQANNVRGQWKRALVSALSVGLGAIGGVTGSMVFRTQDQPHYTPGIATCITAAGLIMVIVVLLNITFMRANKRAAAGGEPVEGLVGFRYTL